MKKAELVATINMARQSRKLSKGAIATAVGLNIKSVDAALSLGGNPQLSTFMAIIDAVGLEVQLVPKGFGMPTADSQSGTAVPSVVDVALGRV